MPVAESRSVFRSIAESTELPIVSPNRTTGAVLLGLLAHPLFVNLVSFFLLSIVSFRQNAPYLFHGFDGRFEVTLIGQGTRFVPPMAGFTNDFLHGLGNVWFTVNAWFIPEYFLSLTTPGDFTDFPLAYTISATELFVGTYALGRILAAPRLTTLAAAWAVSLLSFQYAGWNLVPVTFRAFPHYALVAAITDLMAAALLCIGRGRSITSSAIPAVLFFAAVTYVVIVAPTLLILAVPQCVVFALVSLLACRSRHQLGIALCAMGAIFAACLLAGYAHFIAGLVSYTAANEFKGLSIVPRELANISMLFWNPIHPRVFTIERSFVLLGIVGALWAIARAHGVLRLAACGFAAVTVLYIGAGLVHLYYPFWYGPEFWYFEGCLFPYHAIFGALLVTEAVRFAVQMPTARRLLMRWVGEGRLAAVFVVALAIVPWFFVRHEQKLAGPPDLPYFTPYPQPETPITKILKEELALAPGAPFRGREATLNGRIFPNNINVDISGLSDIPNVLAYHATGNSHSTSGLWQDSVPTLVEYDPLMTPPYFAFMRSFFTEPADVQIRNIVAMRRINPRLLAAIGVRFVVTDRPYDGAVRLRQALDVPVSEDELQRLGIRQRIPSFTLYLYELKDVNLGQYSPVNVRVAPTASAMLDALADPALDLSGTAILSDALDAGLAPAHLIHFDVDRGSFTVAASSAGVAMLILPMEYSHCLHLSQHPDGGGKPRLVRVDLLMTGIIFDRHLEATIKYRTAPFGHARCRLQDADDMAQIRMQDAFDKRPEFRP